MFIDDTIKRFGNYHPITQEDQEAFQCAVDCMKYARDFLPLGASPDRIKQALNLLDVVERALGNPKTADRLLKYLTKD